MSLEEVSLRLIELYYKNKEMFKNYCMTITDLGNTYNKLLKVLQDNVNLKEVSK